MSFFRRPAHPSLTLEYRRVLVPLIGAESDEIALRVAAVTLAATKGQASLLHVIEVPFQRRLDAQDEHAVARADEILQRGEELLRELQTDVRSGMVQASAAGAAVVDDAAELGADLIVMGLRYKRRFGGQWDAGSTVPYVMRNSTAPVWCLRTETKEVADVP